MLLIFVHAMLIPPGYGLGLFRTAETEEREEGVCFKCNGCAFIGLACFGHVKGTGMLKFEILRNMLIPFLAES